MIVLSKERIEQLAVELEKRREQHRDAGTETFSKSLDHVLDSAPELKWADVDDKLSVRSDILDIINRNLVDRHPLPTPVLAADHVDLEPPPKRRASGEKYDRLYEQVHNR